MLNDTYHYATKNDIRVSTANKLLINHCSLHILVLFEVGGKLQQLIMVLDTPISLILPLIYCWGYFDFCNKWINKQINEGTNKQIFGGNHQRIENWIKITEPPKDLKLN